jgi:hypothetical protein
MAPATPSTWTDETLFEITLPVDVVPAGELGSMDFHWHTIPANSVTSRKADTCCPGVIAYYVLEGSPMIEGDGPIQVIRHDGAGAIEDYGAGEAADLGPGDVVVVRNDDSQTWTTGAAEAQVVIQSLTTGTSPAQPGSWEWRANAYTYEIHSVVLPGGPYKLTLREVTVEADTIFDLPENVVNQLALRHEGIASVGIDLDNVLKVTGMQEPVTVFVLTLSTTQGGGTTVAGMGTATAATPEP